MPPRNPPCACVLDDSLTAKAYGPDGAEPGCPSVASRCRIVGTTPAPTPRKGAPDEKDDPMSLAELLVTPLGWMLRGKRSKPERSVQFAQELASPGILTVSSPAFEAGQAIPRRHSGIGRGPNISPELRWSGLPNDTKQLLLIVEDTDVPLDSPIIHLIALLEPDSTHGVAEGALTPGNLAAHYVPAFRGWVAYQGPRPLPGHGVHHYGFHLYALDTELDVQGLNGLAELLPKVAGHVLASGSLVGTQRA
jgi:Raf kinase inhibitor-like YbhB/YbcL family protein